MIHQKDQLLQTRMAELEKKLALTTRELEIEAALESVRSRAMAMQKSEGMQEIVDALFNQLKEVGVDLDTANILLFREGTKDVDCWTANAYYSYTNRFSIPYAAVTVLKDIHVANEKNEGLLSNSYTVAEKNELFDYLFHYSGFKHLPAARKQQLLESRHCALSIAMVKKVGVLLISYAKPSFTEEENEVLQRFTKVFSQAYTRFLDLRKAEAQAREATKQAALDRIRADIASMRAVSDLDRITPLVWNELTNLCVPFIRCGVFIMDEAAQQVQTFLSTPDGKAIAAFLLPYGSSDNIGRIVRHWQHRQPYTDHWDREAFDDFAGNLVQQGAFTTPDDYLSTLPPDGFYLHFLPFQQGMLYVGNTAPLQENELQLVQSLADAFSTAYARYEDFNKLEAAKQQVDNTLKELRATQAQLIQSEKMASLGELTAGIAHEIQNPLNFVNNFAAVNKELIEEMKEEIDKGNVQEAKAIADAIRENESKISHHGKRADAIVKSMLQHSRKSSGEKELIDINALVDEYLRLSYHGYRVKDKTFNAVLETHYDPASGSTRVAAQDVGRVLMNLFSNAFYAVAQKGASTENYQPVVSVGTKRAVDRVVITVCDNGTGIPEKEVEKIFQPFFTTKPTGEGTGLGLSLSYDIITKGHGGEIKVDTKEGEGTVFFIQLPLN